MKRIVLAVVAVVLVATGVSWLVVELRGDDDPAARRTTGAATPTPQAVDEGTDLAAKPDCSMVAKAFDPVTITVPGVIRRAQVVTPPRDANDVPGVPPLSAAGRDLVAWDRAQEVRPGDAKGNVLLNTHTWPDGSALGNRLLDGLEVGDRIVVNGDKARLCYRVSKEIEVLASEGYAPYYDKAGKPQLAIIVCSGVRTGPGEWTKRTIWFASPQV